MTPQSIDTVRRLAVETLKVPVTALSRAKTFGEAGIDSLAALDLVFAVEGHYGISIATDDVERMRSLSDLAASVDRLIAPEARRHDA